MDTVETKKPADPRLVISMCSSCVHMQELPPESGHIIVCNLSKFDTRFPAYPKLPVRECDGFQRE